MLAACKAWKVLDFFFFFFWGGGGSVFLTLKGFCQEINGNFFVFLALFCNIQCKFY